MAFQKVTRRKIVITKMDTDFQKSVKMDMAFEKNNTEIVKNGHSDMVKNWAQKNDAGRPLVDP